MKSKDSSPESRKYAHGRALSWIVAGALILGVLAVMPGVWALPEQAPDFQTVPTLTSTPASPGVTATPISPGVTATPISPGFTATPTQPDATATPTQPDATATPTQPGAPANTSIPGTTPTEMPGTATPQGPGGIAPTATPSVAPTVPTTPTPLLPTPTLIRSSTCWTVPTPGFEPVRSRGLEFEASSDQALVVPGQALTLRLKATNRGSEVVKNVSICSPLIPALQRSKPMVSQGKATLVPEGLIVEVGNLLPGQSVTAEIPLTIPISFPLGGVVENQAWLLADGQRSSTSLLTWALPPAYLPPTGK